MKSWVSHLWNDEDAFKSALRAASKWVVVILGGLVTSGVIPADGFGKYVGPILVAIGAAFPTQSLMKVASAPSMNLLSQKLKVVDVNVKKVAAATDVSLVVPNGDKTY